MKKQIFPIFLILSFCTVNAQQKKDTLSTRTIEDIKPVSYTHLDVYKRQPTIEPTIPNKAVISQPMF